MASLRILKNTKNDLFLLNQLSVDDVSTLVEASILYLRNGLSKTVLKQQSQSLGLNTSDVENAITGVTFLLLEFYKHKVSAEECLELRSDLELSEPVLTAIHQIYQKHEREFEQLLREAKMDSAQFRDLQWRLETELGSRSLRNNSAPRVILSLGLDRHGQTENTALVSDIPNIIHFSHMVEQALSEGRSQNSRKLQRILQ